MSRSKRVFVTYSRHDNEVDRVSAICKWLTQLSHGQLEFVLDSSLARSSNVFDFERSLENYRACLVIGTRKYKEKVISGEFGVSREFHTLIKCIKKRSIRAFTVVTESSFEEVFPDDLKGPLATNFSGISHNPEFNEISNHSQTKFQSEAKILVEHLLSIVNEKPKDKANIEKIRQNLIFEQKHELMSANIDNDTLNKIFVKTSYFNAVINKSSYLLIGRKGSGKSFLTDYFLRFPEHDPTVNVLFHLRSFRLITLYTMGTRLRLKNELNEIISQADVFECAWSVIFTVGCVAQLYIDIMSGRIDGEINELTAVRALLDNSELIDEDAFGEGRSLSVQRLIDWSTEKVLHIIEAGIESLSGEYARSVASIQSLVDPKKVITAIVGVAAMNEFSGSVQKLQPCFFIAIDGFDTKFDSFRHETNVFVFNRETQTERVRFEIDWLAGLVEASFDLIRPAAGAEIGFRGASYNLLVTLPRDRFIEVHKNDRDGFRLRHKYVNIEWTAPELANLARKRLEYYYSQKCSSSDIFEKLTEALMWIGGIPKLLDFNYNGNVVKIGIFEYMLRHSFWRPRDIIYHVSLLIDRGERNRKIGRKISVENIREIASSASSEIIENEFIGEFKSIFPEIEETIFLFRESGSILKFSELFSLISTAEFRLSSGELIEGDIAKVDFLYEIGFLGIFDPAGSLRRAGFIRKESFSFSDSIDSYRRLRDDDKRKVDWIIHPIFTEYLNLQTDGAEFPLNYEKSYLIARD